MTAPPVGAPRLTRRVGVVFPGDTDHLGTLSGGVGLARMDEVAFIAAARHAPVDFVTASCERIDFRAPAHLGDIVELTGRVTRVGRRSLRTEVDLVAEAPLTGERRLCARGAFNVVAVGAASDSPFSGLPPPVSAPEDPQEPGGTVEMVFPGRTNHYGILHGGDTLAAMGRAAFVAATRHCRERVVLKLVRRVDLTRQVNEGEVVEPMPEVVRGGRRSFDVAVAMWAETSRTGERRRCGHGEFVISTAGDGGDATEAVVR